MLEDFSAPCILNQSISEADLLHIMRFARSDFSRWDAQQQLFINALKANVTSASKTPLSEDVIDALRALLSQREGDLALVAELLKLPSFDTLAAEFEIIPVDQITANIELFEQQIATQLHSEFLSCYQAITDDGSVSAQAVAIRALKQLCLHYLAKTDSVEAASLIEQAASSTNMTNVLGALSSVVKAAHPLSDQLLSILTLNGAMMY